MPQAIGVALLGQTLAATTLLGSITLGSIVGGTVLLGATLALQYFLTPHTRVGQDGAGGRSQEAQAVINQAYAPRVRYYGRVKVGGVRAFFDSRDGILYQAIMLMSGRVHQILEYWIGDQIVVTANGENGGDVLTEPFYRSGNPAVHFEPHFGDPNQAASAFLLLRFPDIWTTSHQLKGISYVLALFEGVTQEEFTNVFQSSYNTPIRVIIRGARVYDPRNAGESPTSEASWWYSENASLCILDYLRHTDGLRKPPEQIDFTSFAAFADRCDESVALAAGGTEPRYRLMGGYNFSEDPNAVLRRMLDTCDAELYETGEGKIAIRGGAWATPSIVIDDVLSFNLERGNNKLAAYNELRPIYTSPEHDFQPTEADPWIDDAAQAAYGRVAEDFAVDMVQSFTQARRLAKIKMAKDNPRWRGTIVTDLRGLELLQPQDNRHDSPTFTLKIDELGIDDTFLVRGLALRPDLSGVEIQCISLPSSAYDWDPATEDGDEAPPPGDTRPIV